VVKRKDEGEKEPLVVCALCGKGFSHEQWSGTLTMHYMGHFNRYGGRSFGRAICEQELNTGDCEIFECEHNILSDCVLVHPKLGCNAVGHIICKSFLCKEKK
jgi:hypothetical protein